MKCYNWIFIIFTIALLSSCKNFARSQAQLNSRGRLKFGQLRESNDVVLNKSADSNPLHHHVKAVGAETVPSSAVLKSPRATRRFKTITERSLAPSSTAVIDNVTSNRRRVRGSTPSITPKYNATLSNPESNIQPSDIHLLRSRKRNIPSREFPNDQPTKIQIPTKVDRNNVARRSRNKSENISEKKLTGANRRSDSDAEISTENIRKSNVRTFQSRNVMKKADEFQAEFLNTATTAKNSWKNSGKSRSVGRPKNSNDRISKKLNFDEIDDENYPEHFKLLLKNKQETPEKPPQVRKGPNNILGQTKSNEVIELSRQLPKSYHNERSQENSDEILQLSRAIPKIQRVPIKREDTSRATLKSQRIEKVNIARKIQPPAQVNEFDEEIKSTTKPLFKPRRAEPYRPKPTTTSTTSTTDSGESTKKRDAVDLRAKYKSRVNTRLQFPSLRIKGTTSTSAAESFVDSKNDNALNERAVEKVTSKNTPTARSHQKSLTLSVKLSEEKQRSAKNPQHSSMKFSSRYRGDAFSRYQLKVEDSKPIYTPTIPTTVTTEPFSPFQTEGSIEQYSYLVNNYKSDSVDTNNDDEADVEFDHNVFSNKNLGTWNMIEPIPGSLTRSEISVDTPEQPPQQSSVTVSIFEALADILSRNSPVTTASTTSTSTSTTTTTTTTTSTTELPEIIQVLELNAPKNLPNTSTVYKNTKTDVDAIRTTNNNNNIYLQNIYGTDNEVTGRSVDLVDTHLFPRTDIPITQSILDLAPPLNTNTLAITPITHNTLPQILTDKDLLSTTLTTNLELDAFTNKNLTNLHETKSVSIGNTTTNPELTATLSEFVTLPNNPPTSLPMPFLADALTTPGSSLVTQPQLITAITNFLDTSVQQTAFKAMATGQTTPKPFENTTMTPTLLVKKTTEEPPVTISFLDLFTIRPVKISQQTEDVLDVHPVYKQPESTTTPYRLNDTLKITALTDTSTISSSNYTYSTVRTNGGYTVNVINGNHGSDISTSFPLSSTFQSEFELKNEIETIDSKKNSKKLTAKIQNSHGLSNFASNQVTSGHDYKKLNTVENQSQHKTDTSQILFPISTTTPLFKNTHPPTTILNFSNLSSTLQKPAQETVNQLDYKILPTSTLLPQSTDSNIMTTTYRSRFGSNRLPILPPGSRQKNVPTSQENTSSTLTLAPIITTTTVKTSTTSTAMTTTTDKITNFTTPPQPMSSIEPPLLSPPPQLERTQIKDFAVYGILPNNTVVRKRPTSRPTSLESTLTVYGILPNQTLVRKYPNGTIAVVDPREDIEVVDIDPKMLFNPFSELYRTSQSSLLKTTSAKSIRKKTPLYIENNDIGANLIDKTTPYGIRTATHSQTIYENPYGIIISTTNDPGGRHQQKTHNLINPLVHNGNQDNLLNFTTSIVLDSNTENAVLLDLLKRKYINSNNPKQSSNVFSLTTARNIIDEENPEEATVIPENLDLSNNVLTDADYKIEASDEEELLHSSIYSKVPHVGILPAENKLPEKNNEDNSISPKIPKTFDSANISPNVGMNNNHDKGRTLIKPNYVTHNRLKLIPIAMTISNDNGTRLLPINTQNTLLRNNSGYGVTSNGLKTQYSFKTLKQNSSKVNETTMNESKQNTLILDGIRYEMGNSKFLDTDLVESVIDSDENREYLMIPELKVVEAGEVEYLETPRSDSVINDVVNGGRSIAEEKTLKSNSSLLLDTGSKSISFAVHKKNLAINGFHKEMYNASYSTQVPQKSLIEMPKYQRHQANTEINVNSTVENVESFTLNYELELGELDMSIHKLLNNPIQIKSDIKNSKTFAVSLPQTNPEMAPMSTNVFLDASIHEQPKQSGIASSNNISSIPESYKSENFPILNISSSANIHNSKNEFSEHQTMETSNHTLFQLAPTPYTQLRKQNSVHNSTNDIVETVLELSNITVDSFLNNPDKDILMEDANFPAMSQKKASSIETNNHSVTAIKDSVGINDSSYDIPSNTVSLTKTIPNLLKTEPFIEVFEIKENEHNESDLQLHEKEIDNQLEKPVDAVEGTATSVNYNHKNNLPLDLYHAILDKNEDDLYVTESNKKDISSTWKTFEAEPKERLIGLAEENVSFASTQELKQVNNFLKESPGKAPKLLKDFPGKFSTIKPSQGTFSYLLSSDKGVSTVFPVKQNNFHEITKNTSPNPDEYELSKGAQKVQVQIPFESPVDKKISTIPVTQPTKPLVIMYPINSKQVKLGSPISTPSVFTVMPYNSIQTAGKTEAVQMILPENAQMSYLPGTLNQVFSSRVDLANKFFPTNVVSTVSQSITTTSSTKKLSDVQSAFNVSTRINENMPSTINKTVVNTDLVSASLYSKMSTLNFSSEMTNEQKIQDLEAKSIPSKLKNNNLTDTPLGSKQNFSNPVPSKDNIILNLPAPPLQSLIGDSKIEYPMRHSFTSDINSGSVIGAGVKDNVGQNLSIESSFTFGLHGKATSENNSQLLAQEASLSQSFVQAPKYSYSSNTPDQHFDSQNNNLDSFSNNKKNIPIDSIEKTSKQNEKFVLSSTEILNLNESVGQIEGFSENANPSNDTSTLVPQYHEEAESIAPNSTEMPYHQENSNNLHVDETPFGLANVLEARGKSELEAVLVPVSNVSIAVSAMLFPQLDEKAGSNTSNHRTTHTLHNTFNSITNSNSISSTTELAQIQVNTANIFNDSEVVVPFNGFTTTQDSHIGGNTMITSTESAYVIMAEPVKTTAATPTSTSASTTTSTTTIPSSASSTTTTSTTPSTRTTDINPFSTKVSTFTAAVNVIPSSMAFITTTTTAPIPFTTSPVRFTTPTATYSFTNPYKTTSALPNANNELERNIKLLEQLIALRDNLNSKPKGTNPTTSTFSTILPSPSTTSTTTTTSSTTSTIRTPAPSIPTSTFSPPTANGTSTHSDIEDIKFLNSLRQILSGQQRTTNKPFTPMLSTLKTTTTKRPTIAQQKVEDLSKSLSTNKLDNFTEKKELSEADDLALLNSLREIAKINNLTTSKPPTFANRIIELALKNRQLSSTTPMSPASTRASTTTFTTTSSTPKPRSRTKINDDRPATSGGPLKATDIEKHRQDQSQLSADLALLSRLLGRPISPIDIPQLAQQFGGRRNQKPATSTRRTTTTTTTTTTLKPSTTTQTPGPPMTRDELMEIEKNLNLLSSLLGRRVQIGELPTIMQELRLRRNLKGQSVLTQNAVPTPSKATTSSTSSTTTTLRTTTSLTSLSGTANRPGPISQQEIIELLRDPAIELNENIETYGKTSDAILAAVLKQRGIGPASNNLPINDLFRHVASPTPYTTTKPPIRQRPTQPPQRQNRPVLDGLSWLWRTWQQTAPSNRPVRNERPVASTPLESPLTLGAATSGQGEEFADLRYPTNENIGGNGLLGAAFGVTRAVTQFLGAAFQGATRSVQTAFIPQTTAQNNVIGLSG